MKPWFQNLIKLLVPALVLLGVLTLIAWHFPKTIQILVSDENWSSLLATKEGGGAILGALIGGLLTITAGVSTVFIYLRQSRSENLRHFLEWLSDFNSTFHHDPQFADVRVTLAKNRASVRHQIILELIADDKIKADELPTHDQRTITILDPAPETKEIDWNFLLRFTDYLYFFEQILAFGEVLARRGSRTLAPTLVNHFGWFLRSLCICWWEHGWSEDDKNKAEAIFVLYLAHNRYRRLAEVALLLRLPANEPTDDFDQKLFQKTKKILDMQGGAHAAESYEQLRKHWCRVTYERGFADSQRP